MSFSIFSPKTSLGITLYELATAGMGPYTAARDDAESVLKQVRAGDHLPLRLAAPTIPRDLERVILRAIHPKVRRRYQRAEDLATDLGKPMQATPGQVTPPKPVASARRPLRRSVSLFCAAAVCGALLAAAAYVFWPPNNPDREKGALGPPATAEDNYPYLDAEENAELRLLAPDGSPLWRAPRLLGNGNYQTAGGVLRVYSMDDKPTLFPLADSTLDHKGLAWFEFSVEVQQSKSEERTGNELGIWWGGRKGGQPGDFVCFAVQLDERNNQVTIGTSRYERGDGARSPLNSWLRPLHPSKNVNKSTIRLPKESKPGQWHRLHLRVLDHRMTLTLDDGPSQEFTLAELQQIDPSLKNVPFDPQGSMGIWVRKGTGSFCDATYKRLRPVE